MPHLEKFIYRLTVGVGVTVLCLMMVQIVIDVFMRSWLGSGFPATAELVSRYYMVLVSFLPIAYVEVRRRHVEATIFTDHLPAPIRRFLFLISFILGLFVYLLLTWGTMQEALNNTAQKSYVEAGSMDFLTWPSYWILPISFGLMSLVLCLRIISILRGEFDDRHHDPSEIIDSESKEEV